ncbi:putative multidrug resistance protein EmrY [Marinomonas spartinae]|uniref:Putative multidrug resistance protein EmrY n=1 Tax=Marinomonas spartinae TaxID=1792290 RepID=A0A1A8THA5_9GAMM|nr:DHA2 family efflux MFS transporter permease subunit [Marinomonas spartinae]SBS32029.1 putative multidrug resistance protein EmrY [Marinomonas spartinae]
MRGIITIHPAWVLFCVILGTTTVSLNNSTINPAIPVFIEHFHLSPMVATWIMAAFMTSMGITMPLTNYLSQKFGRKCLYLTGIGIFLVGSIMGAWASSIEAILTARVIQGIASGLIIPLSLALIYAVYPKPERGRITGIWGAAVMLSPAVGPLIGSLIIETFSWPALFLINLPFAFVALVVGIVVLPKTKQESSASFDGIGYLLIAFGIGVLLFATGQIRSLEDFQQLNNLLLICVGISLLIGFVIWSLRHPHPLLDLTLFSITGYRYSTIIAVAQAIAMFETLFLLPLLIQMVLGLSPIVTGLLLLTTAICASLAGQFAGKQLDQKGPQCVVTCGLIIAGGATLGLGFISIYSPLWLLYLVCALRGVGVGLSYIPITTAGINTLPDKMVTQGSVMNNISRRLCSSLMLVLGAIWLELSLNQTGMSLPDQYASAISSLFLMTGSLILLTFPLALFFPKEHDTFPKKRGMSHPLSINHQPLSNKEDTL